METKKTQGSPELFVEIEEVCDVLATSTPDSESDPFGVFAPWEV